MKNTSKTIKTMFGVAVAILAIQQVHADARPLFSLIPTTPTKLQIPAGGAFTVKYSVTNNTKKTRTLTIKPVIGTRQVTGAGLCSSPFVLNPGQSCVMAVEVNSAVGTGSFGPTVCKTKSVGDIGADPFLCSVPAPVNTLVVNVVANESSRRLAIGSSGEFVLNYISTDGALSWAPPTILPNNGASSSDVSTPKSIDCDDLGIICALVGGYGAVNAGPPTLFSYATNDGGNLWTVTSPTPPSAATNSVLNSVACSTSGLVCNSVGWIITPGGTLPLTFNTSDGGNTWSTPVLPTPPIGGTTNRPSTVACSDSGLKCVMMGRSTVSGSQLFVSYTTQDGGQSWSAPNLLTSPAGGSGNIAPYVDCDSSGNVCTAVGNSTIGGIQQIVSYATTDGGETWSAPVVLPPVTPAISSLVNAISCSSSGLFCAIVGNTGSANLSYTTFDGGKTWSGPSYPAPFPTSITFNALTDVICDDTGLLCTAIGWGRVSLTTPADSVLYSLNSNNGGNTWAPAVKLPDAPPPVDPQTLSISYLSGSK